jgi:taurine--2-oxoglutarate transaminase
MICDETITAFGRTGAWFGVDHWDVKPDIATFAKGISSGMTPMSGMAVSGPIADVFAATADGFPWGHTFSGNPLGCAVACEVIRTIRDEGLVENARAMGERLRAGLDRIAAGSPHIGQVRGRGLLQGMELVTDRDSLEPLPGGSGLLTAAARARNLMIYSCPTPLGRRTIEAVMLAPPLIVDDADVDTILERLADAVGDLTYQTAT